MTESTPGNSPESHDAAYAPAGSPARVLSTAKDRAGDYAVAAARNGDYPKAYRWRDLAIDIDTLLRRVIEEMAR